MSIKELKALMSFKCIRCKKLIFRDQHFYLESLTKQMRIGNKTIRKEVKLRYCVDCGSKKRGKIQFIAKTRYEYIAEG